MTEISPLNVNVGPKASALSACASPIVLAGDYRNWSPITPVWMEKPLANGVSSKPVEAFVVYRRFG